MLNFFQSSTNVEIQILEKASIQVVNNGRIICEGSKEECMAKIRREVFNLQGLGGRTIRFTIKVLALKAASPKLIADAVSYFRNHLAALKSSINSSVRIPIDNYNCGVTAAGVIF